MLSINFNLHKRNTANAGKKLAFRKTLTVLKVKPLVLMSSKLMGKRNVSHKKTYVGINNGCSAYEMIFAKNLTRGCR
jgi:hypothetical protein